MSENRLVDNGDGTVTDALTQLMWMQNDSYLEVKPLISATNRGEKLLKYQCLVKDKIPAPALLSS